MRDLINKQIIGSTKPIFEPVLDNQTHLRILTYNIQAGLPCYNLRDQVAASWRNVLPSHAHARQENLARIADMLQDYDVVALQEIDAGSMRTKFTNQVRYLAQTSGFPYWYLQINRNFGKFAKHSNAVLSRLRPFDSTNYKLPGLIPGRGAMRLLYGDPKEPLVLVIMHLALGPVARRLQLRYIEELIAGYEHIILMGDMNCRVETLIKSNLIKNNQLRPVNYLYNTFPSWNPRRNIDHILVSPSVRINDVKVLNLSFSDHLPIALDVSLPQALLQTYKS